MPSLLPGVDIGEVDLHDRNARGRDGGQGVTHGGVPFALSRGWVRRPCWASLCPGNCESAGKRLSGRPRNGNRAVREVLVEARTRNTYLSAVYHRLEARRDGKSAVVAVAHAILVIAHRLLTDGGVYVDLDHNYFDRRARDKVRARLTRRLEAMGFEVTLTERAGGSFLTSESAAGCFRGNAHQSAVDLATRPLYSTCLAAARLQHRRPLTSVSPP